MTDTENHSQAMAIAEIVRQHIAPQILDVKTPDGLSGQVAILPESLRVESIKPMLDCYRERPERRKGTARLQDIDSLIAHVNRFKTESSALFADRNMQAPSITGVINYHEAVNCSPDGGFDDPSPAPQPDWSDHRAHYAFPLSDEWRAWHEHNGKPLDQQQFAEFLEDRIGDVLAPPSPQSLGKAKEESQEKKLKELLELLGGTLASPSRLMELSRGLSVRIGETVQNVVNLSTGEAEIRYAAAHSDDKGGPLKVPNLFLIGIPVFRAGDLYQLAVRLRYRARGGAISWSYELYRPEKVFEHAFDEACVKAKDQTGLPLFMGHPEAGS